MKVADLFVKLGIQGTAESSKGIKKVDKGMQGLVSRGMAVKASLLALGYGLQRVMTSTAAGGTSLKQFAASTDISVKSLQQWQYAGKRMGVQAEEIAGSFKGLQSSLTEMAINGGLNKSLALIGSYTDVDPSKLRDTVYMMEKLRDFAKSAPADVTRNLFSSLSIPDNVLGAMRTGAFDDINLKNAPILSESQINNLNKVNHGWQKLGYNLNMAMQTLNAEHGTAFINDLNKLIPKVMELTKALVKLADKAKVFEAIGVSIEGWSKISGAAANEIGNLSDTVSGKKSIKEGYKNSGYFKAYSSLRNSVLDYIAPNKATLTPPAKNPDRVPNQNVNVNQTLNFNGNGDNAQEVGREARRAVQEAFKSTKERNRGN